MDKRLIEPRDFQISMNSYGIQYFTAEEFLATNPHRNFSPRVQPLPQELFQNAIRTLVLMDRIRERWGGPIRCLSGYRSPEYNTEVGGADRSRHMFAGAADLQPFNGELERFSQLCLDCLNLYEIRGIPTGHKMYRSFVHVDINVRGQRGTWRG